LLYGHAEKKPGVEWQFVILKFCAVLHHGSSLQKPAVEYNGSDCPWIWDEIQNEKKCQNPN